MRTLKEAVLNKMRGPTEVKRFEQLVIVRCPKSHGTNFFEIKILTPKTRPMTFSFLNPLLQYEKLQNAIGLIFIGVDLHAVLNKFF